MYESDRRRARMRRDTDHARRAAQSKFDVRVEPLRRALVDRLERGEVTLSEVARRMGWMKPDTHRVRRSLGMTRRRLRDGFVTQEFLTDEVAEALAEAIGVDPVDVDF